MNIAEEVERVRQLSDEELLAALGGAIGTQRQLTARVVAHLGEVEERRLHWRSGCESMFVYCTTRLGMSEDEAGRRIAVARLARRFPLLLEGLLAASSRCRLPPCSKAFSVTITRWPC